MSAPVFTPHEPKASCEPYHCYFHHIDEPVNTSAAIVCGECLHTYPTEAALLAEVARLHEELGIERIPTSADQVHTCPLCAHDF